MLATIEQQTDEINQFPRRLDQLARQAFRDSLTSLPNRSLFMDRLAHALTRTERRGEQLAILFLDLDRFKVVNDSLGHGVGDQLLIGVSQRLASCLRPEDTIARLGGDEFGVLLRGCTEVGAGAAIDRIYGALSVAGVAGSIGWAPITVLRGFPAALAEADNAMYAAKAARRSDRLAAGTD
jgi:diguanylate cyclase (GGDEF)-like protein